MLSQNPSADVKTVLDIVDSNSGVNFDSNGIRRPIEYLQSLGIDLQQEKYAIYQHRPKLPVENSIPVDIQVIRHIDENVEGGIREEIFFHEFPDFWICAEPTDLRGINGQKWYLDGTFYAVSGLKEYQQVYIISTKSEERNKVARGP